MISARTVAFILTTIWMIVFFITRKNQFTSKWYFYLLFTMSTAGIFLDLDRLVYYVTKSYSFINIILFAILLLLVLIPWLKYDKWLKFARFSLNDRYLGLLKFICVVCMLLSLFCIMYCMPYAILANSIGAEEIRTSGDGSLLPLSFLTTLATGVATLAPIGVLLFYIGLLDLRLKKYAIGVLLLPIAGVVHSMTLAARELYIFLPLIFVFLYVAFANSLPLQQQKLLKRVGLLGGIFLLFSFITITINRFGNVKSDSFVVGTWGYLYQQPFVFDQTLQYFDNFYEFNRRLKFLRPLLGLPSSDFSYVYKMEWSFGTMYKEFYEMFGYSSLIVGTFIYIAFFTIMCKICIRRKNVFSTLVNFTIFIWFTISGLFYFRYGGIDAQFILYMLMMLLAPIYPRLLYVSRYNNKDKV